MPYLPKAVVASSLNCNFPLTKGEMLCRHKMPAVAL
jgi:hypothetical protein